MTMMKSIWKIAVLAVGICSLSAAGVGDMAARLDSLLADSSMASAQIGIEVYDITVDSAVFCRDCEKLFTPASNMKLFTSAAALELLGSSYRFKTEFFSDGDIDKKGKLNGDLIIVGGGDPLISGRFRDGVTSVLELWADTLIQRGIREINGDILIDNSFFTGSELGAGWSWNELSYWYACPISALSFNDNCVDLYFQPGPEIGAHAKIRLDPPTDYIDTTDNAVTVPPDSDFTLDYYRIPYTNDVEFFGGIPISDTQGVVDYVSVDRPDIYCAYIFCDVLRKRDIKFKGEISEMDTSEVGFRSESSDDSWKPIFTWHSDSLPVVISVINKNSQNFFAEQTLKTIGKELGGEGSFDVGLELVTTFLDSIGIGEDDIAMYDGSGLSHYNIVKPEAVIRLFRYMSTVPDFDIYYESLAIPGVDRSVKKRLEDSEFREHARTKTGSIANTRTFSGYINGPKTGHLLAFSIMVNNFSCKSSYVLDWLDSAVEVILTEY